MLEQLLQMKITFYLGNKHKSLCQWDFVFHHYLIIQGIISAVRKTTPFFVQCLSLQFWHNYFTCNHTFYLFLVYRNVKIIISERNIEVNCEHARSKKTKQKLCRNLLDHFEFEKMSFPRFLRSFQSLLALNLCMSVTGMY